MMILKICRGGPMCPPHDIKQNYMHRGLTLIELTVVFGIVAAIAGITGVGMLGGRRGTDINTSWDIVFSDIKQQQLKAMQGAGSTTLDLGSIAVDSNIAVTSTFANNKIVFTLLSGDISNFVSGQDTVTLSHTISGASKTWRLNKYAVATSAVPN